jgi:hypothetical protein
MRNTVWSRRLPGLRGRSIPRNRRHPDGAHSSYNAIEVRASRDLVRRSRALPWRVRSVTRADLMNSAAATPLIY